MALDKARCAECPLCSYWKNNNRFEPLEFVNNGSDVLIIGDAPSKQATGMQRAWADRHGAEVAEALEAAGSGANDVDWGNLIGCRWPKDDAQAFFTLLKRRNRKRVAKGKAPLPSPIEACRGHVEEELARYRTVIPLGSLATKAMYGTNPALKDVRGGPTVISDRKVLASFHPSRLVADPHLRQVLRSDIAKALRHNEDALKWDDPTVHYSPSVEFVAKFFAKVKAEGQMLTYDLETDDVDCLTADLRCVGIGTDKEVLILGFVSIDGVTRFYSPEDEEQIRRLLREVFHDGSILIAGHNAGYFDRLVSESHGLGTPRPLLDTILLHKLAESEHRHSLGFIGSVLTDVPAWKADHSGVEAKTDDELHSYCATDVAVTARIAPLLRDMAKRRKQTHLYPHDAKVQDLCAGMRRLGMRVDEGRRFEHEQTQTKEATKWLRIINDMQPGLNPNSSSQLGELLFDKWALPPHEYTSGGEPSTKAAVLRALITNPLLDEEQKRLLNAVRFYRRAEKQLSTYIRKLAPGVGVVRDGYVYPDYNAHGTITGRLSSSNPNCQNIPYNLRDIFIPPKGCVFVGADYDQLELRFAAALAGAPHYLEAFALQEIDPHNLTGELMFGDAFWKTEGAPDTKMGKGSGQFKQIRNLAKTICFASLYGAAPPKVLDIVGQAEDNEGNMLYAHYNLRQIRALHRRWLQQAPEFKRWWDSTLRECRRLGYVEEVVLRRRRYFAKEDYNAILNFGVQAGGFAIVAQAMIDLVENHIPFDFAGGTGLCNQLHDAVLFAVPERDAEQASVMITETLTRQVDGLPVTFSAEACIGTNWRET
jgi:DNA polymerase I-like protein with 3'-5' exonuclease and polymerase domains/uracil-DNA glycosylase